MQAPSNRCAVRWTRARRTERAMPACYKYLRLLLLSRLHFHAISFSCLHVLNISLSMVKALIHFSTPHKIILKFRKRTMQCFDVFFFLLSEALLDRSTRNCSSARFELDVGDQFTELIGPIFTCKERAKWKSAGENRAHLKKNCSKKVKTDKISENRGPTIISPKRIYESTVKRMFDRAIAIYTERSVWEACGEMWFY